jgi:alpha-tubulin suppressor-like RCC1 family protein
MGNGTVWTVGLNSSGELGNGNTSSQLKAVQVLTASGPLTGVTALAAGASHTLALSASGEVWAWGANNVGQLGNNSTVNLTRAVKVSGLTGIIAIAAGDRFSYAIKNDGTAWAFGDNASGQLGNNSTTASRIPVQVRTSSGNLSGVKAAAGGQGHGVFLTATGSVWSVGLNTSGQLGNNSTTKSLLAVPSRNAAGNLSGIVEVACGDAFTLFLSTNGSTSAVGSNTNGQLGDGTRVNRLTAMPVSGLTSVSFVCAGADRSFAVRTDGSVFAWGGNLYGAQGHGERGLEWSWKPLPQWSAFARAAAGSSHTLWLKADGSVWAAGTNLYGQLGNGLTSDSLVPVQTQSGTGNLTAIQDVAAGTAHSLALAQNGAIWTWGLNSSGRLGDGTSTTRTKAVLALDAAGPISGTSAVAVGDAFSLALRQGAVWAWGVNNYSQLGLGNPRNATRLNIPNLP